MGYRIFPFIVLAFHLAIHTSCAQQDDCYEYETLKKEIEVKRNEISVLYSVADSFEKDSLLKVSRDYLFQTITNDIFQAWYGTPWEFYGMTRVPKEGAIACGYFVTTVLTDAGLNIPRVKWAQAASEVMIKRISTNIRRFHNAPIEDVADYLNLQGDGLYLAGLDNHVGFIVKKGEQFLFVHSNYYQPEIGVMSENIRGHNPLNNSKYRVVGKLLSNEMVEKWILGERIE